MNLERYFALTKNRFRRFATHTLRRARNEQRIIASLTSYPPRIHTAHLAIRSLLAQKTLPDLIVLWLYTGDFPNREADLPQELLDVLARDVQIRWVEQDLKPHKKYYWAFQEFPDELVITFDDDLIYKNTLISDLIAAHKRHPNCVCAMRTHLITFDEQGGVMPYSEWEHESPGTHPELVDVPRMDLFATTGAGTLFCPALLPKCTYDADAISKRCISADDIWLKTMELISGIPVVAATSDQALSYIPNTQHVALWHDNIDGGQNDRYFTQLLDIYNVPGTRLRDEPQDSSSQTEVP